MKTRSTQSMKLTVLVCTVGLGLAGLTGCERSKTDSGKAATANAPTGAQQAGSESPGDNEPGNKPGSLKKKPSPDDSMKPTDNAQPEGSEKPQLKPQGEEGGDKITDAELKKFIEVSNTLRPKQAEMKQKLKNAGSKAEAREAQKTIMEETRKAVEASGLSFDRFRTISRRAKSSKELQMRLQRMAMEQKKKDQQEGGN